MGHRQCSGLCITRELECMKVGRRIYKELTNKNQVFKYDLGDN